MRLYSTHRSVATSVTMPAPSGRTSPPCTCSPQPGQIAEWGNGFPVGNTVALKPFVSRQYDWLWNTRYVRM